MNTAQDQQSRAPADQWKCGNEFLPYHPSASHVEPAYRDGWNACFKAAAQVLAMGRVPVVPVPQSIEQMAVDRYKVVPSHNSMFYPCAVVAGDGQQQLYIGREVECQNMARKFTGAFLDGAFVALTAASPRPPAAQANTGESHISPTSAAQEPSAVSNADGMRVLLPTQPLRSPECWCECCDTVANSGFRSRMSICPGCGDKRCPRAYHHNSDCSAP